MPGSRVSRSTAVTPRGSVQHLALRRVADELPKGRTDGSPASAAFVSLFPAITATGVSKCAALQALARHEEGPRGLYGGAVFRGNTDGALDAALVLRTLVDLPQDFSSRNVRELVDGTTGQRPGNDNVAPGDSAWWEDYRRRLEQVAKEAGSAS
ncbi:chorismate-binding protein [Streptomyces sp. NBC_00624]|uniref:chorismate-binding protein n=1 Tax=Streptomyces sp. NBC_00624 TaxID=2975791 RepID=UPI00386A0054